MFKCPRYNTYTQITNLQYNTKSGTFFRSYYIITLPEVNGIKQNG
jgi:hypothetical protein